MGLTEGPTSWVVVWIKREALGPTPAVTMNVSDVIVVSH